jgi:hypothetical protein
MFQFRSGTLESARVGKRSRGGRTSSAPTPSMLLESLEPRTLLTGFSWTAEEIYLAELVNRARANPMAEGARLGIDLTAGLTAGELARLVAQEPLALNEFLTIAARAHSLDMAQRDFFDHVNPDGLGPTERAQNAGYEGTAGENIAAGYNSIDAVHAAWLLSLDHRKNVLSLQENFTSSFHYDEFGPGFAFTNIGPFFDYHTEEFGVQAAPAGIFLLGVVYDDGDSNSFYGIGEGVSGVRVEIGLAGAPGTIVGTYTTDAAGNYQIPVTAGDYIVRFTHLSSGQTTTRSFTITDENVEVSVTRAQINQGSDMTYIAHGGGQILVSSTGTGRITAAAINAGGRPVVFQQNGAGGWAGRDLVAAAGGPEITGKLITWVDPKDGFVYAAARSESGLILYTQDAGGAWSYRNLTTSVAGASVPGNEITAFAGIDGYMRIAGLVPNGDLVLFFQDGTGSAGNYGWSFANLAGHLQAQGETMPALVGELTSSVTSWNGANIAALDGAGSIHVIWWAPGLIFWRTDNLSTITGAPPLSGGVTAYLTSWGGINLAGLNSAGEVSVTWWVPSFGGNWITSNLTQQFSGSTLTPSSITSYVSSWGGLNIAGIDGAGRVIIYWWAPGQDLWTVTPISDLINGAPLPIGRITGHATPTGSLNIVGADAGGHVVRYHWEIGGSWAAEDITAAVPPG